MGGDNASISDTETTLGPASGPQAETVLPWGRHDFVLRDGVKRWLLKDPLGSGASGTVWRALDLLRDEVQVALKFVPLGNERHRSTFLNEAGKTARLDHPGLVKVQDVAVVDGWGVLVEELVEGGTLSDRLRVLRGQGQSMGRDELERLLRSALDGLAAMHSAGLVHRDIKPSNLALRGDGVVILDLGIASRAGAHGRELDWGNPGTRGYMPPEQEQDALSVLPNADLYALGVTMTVAASGRWPSEGEGTAQERAQALELPEPLKGSIVKAVSASPGDRWADAAGWRAAVEVERPREVMKDAFRKRAPSTSGARQAEKEPLFPVLEEAFQSRQPTAEVVEAPPQAPAPAPVVAPKPRHRGRRTGLFIGLLATLALSAAAVASLPTLRTFGDPDGWLTRQGYEMVPIAGGTFLMGSPKSEPGHESDETQHQVTVSSFRMGSTEVTQRLFRQVMGRNPAATESRTWLGKTDGGACATWGVGDDLPAQCVTWNEAAEFCNRLSREAGLEEVYVWEPTNSPPSFRRRQPFDDSVPDGYRLPTEAEWEHAARAGRWSRYAGTDSPGDLCAFANVANPSTRKKHGWMKWAMFDCDDGHAGLAPVKSFRDNGWGLHDMTGNVWEWTDDIYVEDNTELGSIDPAAVRTKANSAGLIVVDGAERERMSMRGGSWQREDIARVANRYFGGVDDRSWYVGFRVVRPE